MYLSLSYLSGSLPIYIRKRYVSNTLCFLNTFFILNSILIEKFLLGLDIIEIERHIKFSNPTVIHLQGTESIHQFTQETLLSGFLRGSSKNYRIDLISNNHNIIESKYI